MKVFISFVTLATLIAVIISSGFSTAARAAEETIISDRPGKSDNPKTNEPGEFRIESGVYSFTHDVSKGTRTTTQKFGNIYLIGGTAEDMELQVAYDGFSQAQTNDGEQRSVTRASGGETFRYKWNLVGNHEGNFALALLPRLQKTEGLDGEQWQGALGVPFAYDITDDINISFTPEWDIETVTDSPHRAHGVFNAIVLAFDIGPRWNVFLQNSEHTRHIRDGWEATAGAGTSYRASKKLQLDVGVDFGLTRASNNFNLQTGFTYVL